jgi:hypothetical protein
MTRRQRAWLKFLAIIVGSAAGGAFVFVLCVLALFNYFGWISGPGFHDRTEVVAKAPPIREHARFLGTMGRTSGHFNPRERSKTLASGPGRIVGMITVDGKPRSGVRIRLVLNEGVMSQWATSGGDGRYSVELPYGEYEVSGFELDSEILDQTLGGKTDNPRSNHMMGEIRTTVGPDKPGAGIDLDYVDPVVVTGPTGDVSLARPIVLSWKPYPNATAYRIQLSEFKRRGDYRDQRFVFDWSDQPVVQGTTLDLTSVHAPLKKDYYYQVNVDALDDSKSPISTSGNRFLDADFHVVE